MIVLRPTTDIAIALAQGSMGPIRAVGVDCSVTVSLPLLVRRALLGSVLAVCAFGCGSAKQHSAVPVDASSEMGNTGGRGNTGGTAGSTGGVGGSAASDAAAVAVDGPDGNTDALPETSLPEVGNDVPNDDVIVKPDSGFDGGSDAGVASDAGRDGSDSALATTDGPALGVRAWPGLDMVTTRDEDRSLGGNVSDLFYEPAPAASAGSPVGTPVLWAARNDPSTLYRLVEKDGLWTPDAQNGWGKGKPLSYPDGDGSPDAEGMTRAELSTSAVYVAAERNNGAGTTSRLSVLRYDTAQSASSLTATHEWNLTDSLPVVGANGGLEAITWVPDTFLMAHSFFDETKGQLYAPAAYPGHGGGLFFIGMETLSAVYVFALDHTSGAAHPVATFDSGNAGVMALAFDREVGYLWAHCDDGCANRVAILTLDDAPTSATFGRFKLAAQLARPISLPNLNNEGIAIAPESECAGGFKPYFWTDDAQSDGHALRSDSVPCGSFLSQTP